MSTVADRRRETPGTRTIRVGTRASLLARTQTELVVGEFSRANPDTPVETVLVSTYGDRSAAPLEQIGGTGVFVSALRDALLAGEIDVAVHSFKDLPTAPVTGINLAAVPRREDPRDALCARDGLSLLELPRGARVGTGSPRRAAQLRALDLGLDIVPIRGNVDTRLRKLDEGQVDALVVACAGLDRLGLGGRIAERLDPRRFVPAPAQGAVALEARGGTDAARRCWLANHFPTSAAVVAERAVLVTLGGGCRLPLGAYARLEPVDGAEGWVRLVVLAALATPGGVRTVELDGPPGDAVAVGTQAAERLR